MKNKIDEMEFDDEAMNLEILGDGIGVAQRDLGREIFEEGGTDAAILAMRAIERDGAGDRRAVVGVGIAPAIDGGGGAIDDRRRTLKRQRTDDAAERLGLGQGGLELGHAAPPRKCARDWR